MVEDAGGSIVNIILGAAGIGGGLWAAYEKWMRHKVETANVDSGVAVANANEALFNMLTQRLNSLEAEVAQVKAELVKEREYNRVLLTSIISAGGIPPAYPH